MKKKISTLMIGATVVLLSSLANAQTWNLAGNTNATAASRLGTNNNISLRLFTNNAEQVHINANVAGKVGFVGLGTTAPNTRLHVNGVVTATGGTSTNWNTAYTRVASAYTTSRVPRWNGTAFVNGAIFDNGTSVGVGTTTLNARLNVASIDLSGIGTTGSFQIGTSTNYNLVMDNNEVQARYNGGANTLFLNYWGGDVSIATSGGGSYFGGLGSFSGSVGIGISPSYRLHVKQNIANKAINWEHESSTDNWNVGIGTVTLNCRFEFNGVVRGQISSVDGSYIPSSDERLKQDIEPMPSMMENIMQLKPCTYYFKDSRSRATTKSIGFIAQEVEPVLPSSVREFDGGYKGLSYADFGVVAIKGLQELKVELDKKEELINTQQKEIEDLKASFKNLESALAQCCVKYSPAKYNTGNAVKGDQPSLEQNTPNPFTEETSIHYYIPANSTALLKVLSLEGNELLAKKITSTGYGEVRISGSTLQAGTYTYTLLVNNRAVESKLMVLTK